MSITDKEQEQFDAALERWTVDANALAVAERMYADAFGAAVGKAEGTNADKRQAAADLAAGAQREQRDLGRVREQGSRWRVMWHLAAVGRRQPPV